MEKEQKQELGWRVSVIHIPAFHHCELLHVHSIRTCGMQECVIQAMVFFLFFGDGPFALSFSWVGIGHVRLAASSVEQNGLIY